MSVLDIVLIIIGFIFIVISYYISEKVSTDGNVNASSVTEVWGDKEEVTIKERVKDIVSEKADDVIETAEDRLCHLSNEKIIEFKEYSDQVMESIQEEHKQVVFLYNMLNEKEQTTKQLLNDLDVKYAAVSDRYNNIKDKSKMVKNENNNKSEDIGKKTEIKNTTASDIDMEDTNKQFAKKTKRVSDKVKEHSMKNNNKSGSVTADEKPGPDRNDKILALWKQGKSVIEISKHLGIGQGEVKLVIDLFKGEQL